MFPRHADSGSSLEGLSLKKSALQVAEKVSSGRNKCQGTALAVPEVRQNESGFSPCKSKISIETFFSATCLAAEVKTFRISNSGAALACAPANLYGAQPPSVFMPAALRRNDTN